MKCPNCGAFNQTIVKSTVLQEEKNIIKRRRECLKCKERFTTFEKIIFNEKNFQSSRCPIERKKVLRSKNIDLKIYD